MTSGNRMAWLSRHAQNSSVPREKNLTGAYLGQRHWSVPFQ
jgi:hypothetical protein